MRIALGLLALVALSGCGSVSYHTETVADRELKAQGIWTAQDQYARELIDSRFLDGHPYQTGAPDTPIPVRRLNDEQRATNRLLVGDTSIPIPSVSRTLEGILGLAFEPRYVLRGERNAMILLHRGAPATILPIDPSKPIEHPNSETDEAAYQLLRKSLKRDVERLRGLDAP